MPATRNLKWCVYLQPLSFRLSSAVCVQRVQASSLHIRACQGLITVGIAMSTRCLAVIDAQLPEHQWSVVQVSSAVEGNSGGVGSLQSCIQGCSFSNCALRP